MSTPLIKIEETLSRGDRERLYREFWVEMYPSVVKVVEQSFLDPQGAVRNVTQNAIKERVVFCKGVVDELRREKRWSKQRIRDNLLRVLMAKLSGVDLDLDKLGKRASW